MDFALHRRAAGRSRPGRADPRRAGHATSASRRSRPSDELVRPRRCGPSSPRPACSASRLPEDVRRRRARLPRGCARARAGRPHGGAACPCLPTVVLGGAADRRVRHRRRSARRGCPAWSPASRRSPPRSSSPATDARAPPPRTATRDGRRLAARRRRRSCVPAGTRWPTACSCRRRTGDGDVGVFLVDPTAAGVDRSSGRTRPTASPRPRSTLDGVAVAAGDAARSAGRRRGDRRLDRSSGRPAALCRDQAGVVRGGAAHHRRVHQDARAVRPADRHVPGRGPARRRRLHRHRGHPAHRAGRPPGGSAEGLPAAAEVRGRQVLGGRGRPAGRARRPAPARRHRRRPRLPAAPLLPAGPSSSS